MKPLDEVFAALADSRFRNRQHLRGHEIKYLYAKGVEKSLEHARYFIAQRLSPASPPNDGRQTPWRGHPVFVAQHATATCCRSCLEKWHGIARGEVLSDAEQLHVLAAIQRWLRLELKNANMLNEAGSLFEWQRQSRE